MNELEMKKRTKAFGVEVIKLLETLPHSRSANALANQLIRSATSVGANYRSACRGRSKADFISKIGIALEEADESLYWLELLSDTHLASQENSPHSCKNAMNLLLF
jgi:four helix bundle protein